MKRGFLIFMLIFLYASAALASDDAKDLFEKKCSLCHSLSRSRNKIKTLEAWKRTTSRMARKAGEAMSMMEAEKIAIYLAQLQEKETEKDENSKHGKEELQEAEHSEFNFKKVRVDQFIDPSVCGDCHTEIFEQWKGSMHSKAYTDPLWRQATKFFMTEAKTEGEILEMKACVKCHTPLGFRSYLINSPNQDYDSVKGIPAEGIFCNWCHNINEVKHMGDAGYEVEAGGGEDDPSTMLGPRDDANSDYHPTKYSELHTKSEFCGLCHNVAHAANGLPIEQTYTEWKNSPYNTGNPETTVHCQDCHMRQRPGIPSTGKTDRPDNPGSAADGGPNRPHIWTHYFVGGNALVTRLMGNDVNADMAIERLKNAADLKIENNGKHERGELSQLRVRITNSGAGHYLPTGLTEVREMWLDVEIKDADDKTIFRSGALAEDGSIDRNAEIFHTILGDSKGNEVHNPALADRILSDHRVPPKGHVIAKYNFYIPENASSPITIKAVLKYRSAAPDLARLIMGDAAPEIPVIEMAETVEKIEF